MIIKSFKLRSGEEVVARVDDRTNELLCEGQRDMRDVISYVLHRPMVLQFQAVGPGRVGLAFIPYALSNPEIETVTIHASHVVAAFSPSAQVEKQFMQQTSTIDITSTTDGLINAK